MLDPSRRNRFKENRVAQTNAQRKGRSAADVSGNYPRADKWTNPDFFFAD